MEPLATMLTAGSVFACAAAAMFIDAGAVKDLLFDPQGISVCDRLRTASWLASTVLLGALWSYLSRVQLGEVTHTHADGMLAAAALLYLVIQFSIRAFQRACWTFSGEYSTRLGCSRATRREAPTRTQSPTSDASPPCPSGVLGCVGTLIKAVMALISTLVAIVSVALPLWYLAIVFVRALSHILRRGSGAPNAGGEAANMPYYVPGLLFACVALSLAWFQQRAVTARLAAKVAALQEDGVAIATRDRARLATYPDSFPTSWYRVCQSSDIKPGETKTVRMLGLELVVFRGAASGSVSVLGAFCPHMGAHLGVGGRVVGDCLECPFHRWQFATDGSIAHIPYCEAVPTGPSARAQHYHTREYYGWVMFWYDAEDPGNAKNAPPHYEPPRIPDIEDGTLVKRGVVVVPDVRMHLQEFAENSADPQHFQPLHDRAYFPYTSVPIPFMEIIHGSVWEGPSSRMGSGEGVDLVIHDTRDDTGKRNISFAGPMIAEFKDTVAVRILDKEMPAMTARAAITFVGPGPLSFFRFDIPQVGRVHMFQAMSCKSLMLQGVDFTYFAPPHVPSVLVDYVVYNWIQNFRADVSVWENKIFLPRPLLARGDGPIMRMRTWVNQFYPKGTPKRAIALEQPQCAEKSAEPEAPAKAVHTAGLSW